jgi:hypothetical protein
LALTIMSQKAFTQTVIQALRANGYKVEPDVILHPGDIRVDLIASKEGTTAAVEVATNLKEVLDAMSKAAYIRTLPGVTESYVAIPEPVATPEVARYAPMVGVGIFAFRGNSLYTHSSAQRLTVQLSVSYQYPERINRGVPFSIQVFVRNIGQKQAIKLTVKYEAAYPFNPSNPGGNERIIESLEPGAQEAVVLEAVTASTSNPGKYPIFLRIEGPGSDPYVVILYTTVV